MFLIIYQRVTVAASYHQPFEMAPRASSGRTAEIFVMYREKDLKIVADEDIPFVKVYFEDQAEIILKPGRAITASDVKDADILLVRSITTVDKKLLAGSTVQFVGTITAGINHLDTEWLQKEGIHWSNARGFNALPVAQYVVSLLASLQQQFILPQNFSELSAAVIGVGHVGTLVAHYLRKLDINIIACDPLRAQLDKNFVSYPMEHIAEVDLITLHVPLTNSGSHPTFHFIDKVFLEKQKKGAVLVNTSRGEIIDTKDLLQYGKELYWCFDVWENEPYIDHNILDKTFIATPHMAGYSALSKRRGIELIYQRMLKTGLIKEGLMCQESNDLKTRAVEEAKCWQDVILTLFNPLSTSIEMKKCLLNLDNLNTKTLHFDRLRQVFASRGEFSQITVSMNNHLTLKDKNILENLGINIKELSP